MFYTSCWLSKEDHNRVNESHPLFNVISRAGHSSRSALGTPLHHTDKRLYLPSDARRSWGFSLTLKVPPTSLRNEPVNPYARRLLFNVFRRQEFLPSWTRTLQLNCNYLAGMTHPNHLSYKPGSLKWHWLFQDDKDTFLVFRLMGFSSYWTTHFFLWLTGVFFCERWAWWPMLSIRYQQSVPSP